MKISRKMWLIILIMIVIFFVFETIQNWPPFSTNGPKTKAKIRTELPIASTIIENQNNATTPSLQNAQDDCLPATTPWIKVISPNGGEVYQAGQQIAVKWKSCNNPYSPKQVYVRLANSKDYYYYLSGNHFDKAYSPDIGYITAIIPLVGSATSVSGESRIFSEGKDFKITVNVYPEEMDSIEDSSDNTFTITSDTTTKKTTANEINKSTELVRREGDKLILQLDNGKEKTIVDVVGEADVPETTTTYTYNNSPDSRFYTYDKLYKDINYYGVFAGYYVGMDHSYYYLLINKKNGNEVSVPSEKIVISPDKQRVVSYNMDLESGFTMNGFNILHLKGDNFVTEDKLYPTNWGPSNIKWINNSELEIEKTRLDFNNDKKIVEMVRYKLVTDTWGNNSWVEK